MRCFYEVLQVNQDADEAELKKAYRKLALRWHPDKNKEQADVAQERFQEVQNAWEVLSDPQERAWYDSHREQILRGDSHQAGASGDGGGGECPYPEHDFGHFCGKSAFKGFDGSAHGYFAVYSGLFSKLAEEESQAYRRQKATNKKLKEPAAAPLFGGADTTEDNVKAFYAQWCNFQTIKDFAWLDIYNPSSAPGRRIKRLMEAENEKRRKAARKEYVAQVRAVAEFVRDHDPRMAVFQEQAAERKAKRAQEQAEKREAERAAKAVQAAAYQDADWIRAGEEEQLAQLEQPPEDTGPSEMFECVVCDKTYKSEKALKNHEASKKHKEQLKKFKRMMKDEDDLDLNAKAADLQL